MVVLSRTLQQFWQLVVAELDMEATEGQFRGQEVMAVAAVDILATDLAAAVGDSLPTATPTAAAVHLETILPAAEGLEFQISKMASPVSVS